VQKLEKRQNKKQKHMKKLLILGAVAGMLAAPAVLGNQLKVTTSGNNGSPYKVNIIDNGYFKSGTTFDTFCVEKGEFFTPGNPYIYSVDSFIDAGAPVEPMQKLTKGAAQIYMGYLLKAWGASITATHVQNAIWTLQGYSVDGGAAALALFNLGSDQSEAYTGGSVQVLNLYNINSQGGQGSRAQSQLVAVPDGGTTCALLGMAFAGLGLARRKLS
jgi:hypothetical protein